MKSEEIREYLTEYEENNEIGSMDVRVKNVLLGEIAHQLAVDNERKEKSAQLFTFSYMGQTVVLPLGAIHSFGFYECISDKCNEQWHYVLGTTTSPCSSCSRETLLEVAKLKGVKLEVPEQELKFREVN